MIPVKELLVFALAAFGLVITPGPNMIYLVSRVVTQGRWAGFISLLGVVAGFLIHIMLVSFGLTAVLLTVPYAYLILKSLGVCYLLYLALQAILPNSSGLFELKQGLANDTPRKLFSMGFLTSMLNPKIAVFYLSFFPQFINVAYGSILSQSLELGFTQVFISFSVNFLIILSASRMTSWFARNPFWIKIQKWFMASVLAGLAIKMAFEKAK